jgi:hypothetical protein
MIFRKNPVNTIPVFMIIIETGFMADYQKYQKTNGYPGGKTQDIDHRIPGIMF